MVSYQRQEDDDDGLGPGGGVPGVDDVRDDNECVAWCIHKNMDAGLPVLLLK